MFEAFSADSCHASDSVVGDSAEEIKLGEVFLFTTFKASCVSEMVLYWMIGEMKYISQCMYACSQCQSDPISSPARRHNFTSTISHLTFIVPLLSIRTLHQLHTTILITSHHTTNPTIPNPSNSDIIGNAHIAHS